MFSGCASALRGSINSRNVCVCVCAQVDIFFFVEYSQIFLDPQRQLGYKAYDLKVYIKKETKGEKCIYHKTDTR